MLASYRSTQQTVIHVLAASLVSILPSSPERGRPIIDHEITVSD